MDFNKDEIIAFVKQKAQEGGADLKALAGKLTEDKDGDGIPDIQESLVNFFKPENLKAKGKGAVDEVQEKFGEFMSSENVSKVKSMVAGLFDKDDQK